MTDVQRREMIAVSMPDGSLAIYQFFTHLEVHRMSPAAAAATGFKLSKSKRTWQREATDDAINSELARVPGLTPNEGWVRIAPEDVPQDRTFRNAWTATGSKVSIDMPKARDIHRDRLRALRLPKLLALDVEYQRADETDDKELKAEVVRQKRALRDVTADPAIEAATTPEELAAVIPAALRG
jgi:hypothetical protein